MHSVSTTNTRTVCIQFSSTEAVAKVMSRRDNSTVLWTVHSNHRKTRVDRMPNISKKRLLRKKFKKKLLLGSFEKTKSTQTSGSVFAERIEQVKKTKFEIELIKIVDCFLDGHGNYTSNSVSFKLKSL